jgi:ATP-dependent DNA helicase RecG
MPDVLVMTATPIPRTLALTVYGDLDVSTIRDMPPGRRAIATAVKPESRRDDVYELVRKQLEEGRQAYVVYPLIEESEGRFTSRHRDGRSPRSGRISAYRVALLHGRMKQDARLMRAFAAGEIHVLVSTTVIEVGIDAECDRHGDRTCQALRGCPSHQLGAVCCRPSVICILLYQY